MTMLDKNYCEKLAKLLFSHVTDTPEIIEAKYPPRNLPEGAVVSRMAPSPTGFVHLGNLVQGLTSERMSHQSGGILYLRVEDTDAKREVPGAVETLIKSVAHYGINFDEGAGTDGETGDYGPYRQRPRKDIYHVFAKKLTEEGLAYPCFCTEDELSDIHERQELEKANFGYYGKWAVWRDRPMEDIEKALADGFPWVLRFRSTGSIDNKIKVTDLIKGTLELTENDIDHVLLKSDGIPTYHFAHAVDDHLMRTTHVVRGDEWLPSLPFHLQLFAALGWKAPKYLHIGTLMKMDGESKRKLSKRKDPELALTYYRSEGFPPESVREYLMTILNSNFEDWRRANPDADIDSFRFSYKKMNPAGSLFDQAKLRDVSKNVISRMSAQDVYGRSLEWAEEFDSELADALQNEPDKAVSVFAIGRGGKKPRKDIAVWSEVRDYAGFMFDSLFERQDAFPDNFCKTDIKQILSDFAASYNEADDQQQWFDNIKAIGEKYGFCPDMKLYKTDPEQYKGSVADVSMFLRLCVTGKMNSPDMYQVMRILGRDSVVSRINGALEKL